MSLNDLLAPSLLKRQVTQDTIQIDGELWVQARPRTWCKNCGSPAKYGGGCGEIRAKCKIICVLLEKKNGNWKIDNSSVDPLPILGGKSIPREYCKGCGYLVLTYNKLCVNGCSEEQRVKGKLY